MKLHKKVVIAALASVAIVSTASAQTIGVDFNNGGATNQSPGSVSSVGPIPTSGWFNNIDVSTAPGATSVVDTTNTTVSGGATVGFTQGGTAKNGNSIYNSAYGSQGGANATLTADQQLFNGSAQASGGGFNQELALTNIPYATFNVYILVKASGVNQGYGDAGYYDESSLQLYSGATAGATYYFGSHQNSPIPGSGFSYVQATSTSLASPTMEANYVLFSGLTGGIGTSYYFDLNSPTSNGDPFFFGGNGIVSGIEIVNAAATPEPASYLLILCGVGMFFGMRKMRNLCS